MNNCPQKVLISLLNKAKDEDCVEKALAKASVEYQLKPYNIMKLEPEKILQIFRLIQKKLYNESEDCNLEFWVENQLRIFVWVVVVYSFVERTPIEEFVKICLILGRPSVESFGFNFYQQEANNSIVSMPVPATPSQTQKVVLVINQTVSFDQVKIELRREKSEKNKWNEIAKEIFVQSGKKYFRTPKQCREQWLNHLDPTKIKSQWTLLEDYELIKNILNNGRKWSKVAKELGNHRTQHMVKNRYKSMLNAEKKRLLDIDREEILVTKIRQRLESHSSIKKYLSESSRQSKKMCNHEDQGEQKTGTNGQQGLENQQCTLSFLDESQSQLSGEVELNRQTSIIQGKSPKNQRYTEQYWILKEEPDVDDLEVKDFFTRELAHYSSRDNCSFFSIDFE